MFWIGLAVGLAGYLVYISTRFHFRVNEGEVGVLTSFGAAKGSRDGVDALEVYEPGLHFKWPWQKAHSVRMMEQSLELSGEEGGRTAMAEDGTVLRFDSILRFVPVRSELTEFLFGMRSPLEHITGLFTCLLRNEIANFRATSGATDGGSYAHIRGERRELNRRIESFCKKEIGERYGVQFNAVDLTDILPPQELDDALNAVMRAHNEAEAAYARAEADAHQRLVAAERGVEIAEQSATAAEREIDTLAGILHEMHEARTLSHYVERRRAEVLSQARTLFLRSAS